MSKFTDNPFGYDEQHSVEEAVGNDLDGDITSNVSQPQIDRRENEEVVKRRKPQSSSSLSTAEIREINNRDPHNISAKRDREILEYLESKSPEELAEEIDRNLRRNKIVLDRKITYKDEELQGHFSNEILDKMQKIGEALDARMNPQNTFVARLRHNAQYYVSVVINALKGFIGKEVDDPKLATACKAYNEKMKDLSAKEAGNTKKFSKLTDLVLNSKRDGVNSSR